MAFDFGAGIAKAGEAIADTAGKYTLEAWHEKYGTATQAVTIETGKTAEVTFEFNGKVAAVVPMGPILMVDMHGGTVHRTTEFVQQ